MDTKTYLNQVERLEKTIQNKLIEIYHLKTMVSSVTILNENDRVQTSSDKDRIGNTVAKIVDLEREMNLLVDTFMEKRNQIIKQIEEIEDVNMYHVLFSRYVGKKTFDEIAHEMLYSRMQINRLHAKALIEFEKRYGNEYLFEKSLS